MKFSTIEILIKKIKTYFKENKKICFDKNLQNFYKRFVKVQDIILYKKCQIKK